MNVQEQSLLVVRTDKPMERETRLFLLDQLKQIAEPMGMKPLVLSDGLQAGIHSDIRPLLESMVAEQQKTNSLLAALVEALAEEGQDPDAPPARYLDGNMVR
ncbi:hypothetical protein [Metapseudomonas resinovorans]|uniref:hypothetical protein n=1 Tax=Metapseudomonas resinovorans TaxID=53412 RepID=UPI001FE02BE3|nr:hypothetical protein [Pseudomonas resinovorans]